MKIILKRGERVEIELADADGKFVVSYGTKELRVTTDFPDSTGRTGIIYNEKFASEADKLRVEAEEG